MKKIAVVSGANKGIGFAVSKQLADRGDTVILTARDKAKGIGAAESLAKQNLDIRFHELDVTDSKSIANLIKFVEKEFGRLDVLVNNAGIFPDPTWTTPILETNVDVVRKGLETNVYGPYQL